MQVALEVTLLPPAFSVTRPIALILRPPPQLQQFLDKETSVHDKLDDVQRMDKEDATNLKETEAATSTPFLLYILPHFLPISHPFPPNL